MLFRVFAAILLISVFALHSLGKVGYVFYFYSNQASIAANYCENKAKGDMECNGCCHLNKVLGNMDYETPGDKTESTISAAFDFLWFWIPEFYGVSVQAKEAKEYSVVKNMKPSTRGLQVAVPPPKMG